MSHDSNILLVSFPLTYRQTPDSLCCISHLLQYTIWYNYSMTDWTHHIESTLSLASTYIKWYLCIYNTFCMHSCYCKIMYDTLPDFGWAHLTTRVHSRCCLALVCHSLLFFIYVHTLSSFFSSYDCEHSWIQSQTNTHFIALHCFVLFYRKNHTFVYLTLVIYCL